MTSTDQHHLSQLTAVLRSHQLSAVQASTQCLARIALHRFCARKPTASHWPPQKRHRNRLVPGPVPGLPVGQQLVGRPNMEAELFALGRAYQQMTDFHLRRPAPWD
jgi:Asp-tRNA(Asn)/Glu-tRNA(Gln) amidotransferase A subunit family amidase